jgi:hypothetical protein
MMNDEKNVRILDDFIAQNSTFIIQWSIVNAQWFFFVLLMD